MHAIPDSVPIFIPHRAEQLPALGEEKERKSLAEGYDDEYGQFKIGVVLKRAREKAGLTREELAQRLKTKKTVISRIENTLRISNSQPWRKRPAPSVNGSKFTSLGKHSLLTG